MTLVTADNFINLVSNSGTVRVRNFPMPYDPYGERKRVNLNRSTTIGQFKSPPIAVRKLNNESIVIPTIVGRKSSCVLRISEFPLTKTQAIIQLRGLQIALMLDRNWRQRVWGNS